MRAHARVGRVHAIDVGVNLADIGVDAPSNGDGRGVGAATAKRGNVTAGVYALKAGDNGDGAFGNGLHDALGMHLDDFRALMRAVGFDARLTASEAKGFVTASLDCHGQKRHGHLLARGQKAVHLAHGRVGVKSPCQAHKLVGGFAHGGNDSDDVVASLLARDQALSDFLNALRRGDGRAPEFADD